MRFIGMATGIAVLASAFFVGRVTASQMPQAVAQPQAATRFSHFECYQAQFQAPVSAAVSLTDQFQSYQTQVGPADMFCTPVVKKLLPPGRPLRVPAPADHLTCYHIQGPPANQARPIANQLQKTVVQVFTPIYLCVPTNKTG
jgi:hypothetical protein